MGNSPILDRLPALSDPTFAAFQRKLLPGLPGEAVLGARTSALR